MDRLKNLDDLRRAVEHDRVDTVVLAMPDMQGRLQGKRLDAHHFLRDVVGSGSEACSYLLTVDVDMQVLDGFAISGWAGGLGDFSLVPDLSTLRALPWVEGTALVLADTLWGDGSTVVQSPRAILKHQLARLGERGWSALVATELEFLLFDDTYDSASHRRYSDLTPASRHNIDYSVQGTARAEPLLRSIRRGMTGAGLEVEALKGECNAGQFELGFRYADALTTCDNHVVYKTGAKEIAAQHGSALTFMAKYDQREGNSCHLHLSLVDGTGAPVFPGGGEHGMSDTMSSFLAGQLVAARELSLLMAPNVNSYKRYQDGSFAPTALAWGRDNRTCAIRVVGEGRNLRFENRVPGGDVNPYLAVAALIAAGLHGVEHRLALGEPVLGNAYGGDGPRLPITLGEAARLWQSSLIAREAFGDDVVDHYANAADQEVRAFESAVTDWERVRGFERM